MLAPMRFSGVLAIVSASLISAGAAQAASPARIAYVTETASAPARVWTAGADGSDPTVLGPGGDALISPDGGLVAAGLFGDGVGVETGPALALYSTAGAPAEQFLSLATATATPLAFSPDSRYLAIAFQATTVHNVGAGSGLAVLDTTTGVLSTVAHGIVYGASFAPDGSDRIVYARAPSLLGNAPTNLYVCAANGSATVRITGDGRSLNPLWGPRYIAYDRERPRHDFAPVYQVWLRTLSGAARQLTKLRVDPLVSGLVPVGFSASGSRLLTEFVGQDTSESWTVRVPSGRARRVLVGGRTVIAAGISRDGSTLLVDEGQMEEPVSSGRVATVAFGGGAARVLVAHGGQASWNG
jgi:hypothetical protein